MIQGTVNDDGVPIVEISIGGQLWVAIIDTGFNGDLELPRSVQPLVNARFIGRSRSLLAGGQLIEEDSYLVDFPFDGRDVIAETTFVASEKMLIGTRLIREYRLEVDFPQRSVLLKRAADS